MSEENKQSFEEEAKQTANEFKENWNDLTSNGENKKVIAGIMAILFGPLGIHKFILGYTKEGIIQIILTFVTCGFAGIIGLIEGQSIGVFKKPMQKFDEFLPKNLKMPLFCCFHHFSDSRPEICQFFRWFVGKFKTSKGHSEIN